MSDIDLEEEIDIPAPSSVFQKKILDSNAQILITGGAAGASKSYIGLMRHLRWCGDENYKGLVLRKVSRECMEDLWVNAQEMYKKVDPNLKVKIQKQELHFSSGAVIKFGGYENSLTGKERYRGLAFGGQMYDEATVSQEDDMWFLFSRIRTAKPVKDCPKSIWLTCNPDPDCWIFKYVEWYLYPKGHPFAGKPDPQRNGVVRWLLRIENQIVWGDTKEELEKKYSRPNKPVRPISFQCLLGNIYDNPILVKNDPDYVSKLEGMKRVEKERLLLGNWFAREESGGLFQRTWVEEIADKPPRSEVVKTVRAWDLAGTLPTDSEPDPDYTVGVKMSILKSGQYVIEDVVRLRARAHDVDRKIIQIGIEDGKDVDIVIPKDAGSSGKYVAQQILSKIVAEGLYARIIDARTSKADRFRPFSAAAQGGLVKVVKQCATDLWNNIHNNNDFYYDELEKFSVNQRRRDHDDMVDATSDAFYMISKSKQMPTFTKSLRAFSNNFQTQNAFRA